MSKRKFTYEEVYNLFQENNCILLSSEYINNNQKLEYQCSCGNISTTRLRSFKTGIRCKGCSTSRSMETNKQNHNGLLAFQTQEFLDKRKLTFLEKYGVESPLQNEQIKQNREATCLSRYGVKHVTQVREIKNNQRAGFLKKYGVTHFSKIPSSMAKFKNTLMERYNVPSLAHLSKSASKESQDLFDILYNLLLDEHKDKVYYASLNKEFTAFDTNNSRAYKYDFTNTYSKKIIEYNGFNFHPRDNQDENDINWCAFHPTKTVKEAREYEASKYQLLIDRGYQILTIWDYEFKTNKQQTINRCISFLLSVEINR